MTICHPTYDSTALTKYRLTYSDPTQFMSTYLYQRYNEEDAAWMDRQRLKHNPAFAREAVDEFARALVQRSSEIKRIGGHPLYQRLVEGLEGGVDRQGNSMNAFLSKYIIGELMAMGSVGIYVDNDPYTPSTLVQESKPYIYSYIAEDILNWHYQDGELMAILLRDHVEKIENGLPTGYEWNYRKILKTEDGIFVQILDESEVVKSEYYLALPHIPFVRLHIPYSLLRDTADYQITLLNIRSASIYLTWSGNFPLYTEQYDPHAEFARRTDPEDTKTKIGTLTGVRYPRNTERPEWIHPSSEPLKVTMEQEEKLKQEIRQLTALAITNLSSRLVSAESKAKDREGLESGLSVIGMALQSAESLVSMYWHNYKKAKPAQIQYPRKYELLGEEERRANAKELNDLQHAVPSVTFQKETAKIIASTLHGHRVPYDTLMKMHEEIDVSPVPTADPKILKSDHEAGFVSDETASIGRGYKKGEATKARKDHAERIARIQAAQSSEGARGLKDLDTNPGQSSVNEKTLAQDPTKTDNGSKPVRKENK